jgi:hypothetical protein
MTEMAKHQHLQLFLHQQLLKEPLQIRRCLPLELWCEQDLRLQVGIHKLMD